MTNLKSALSATVYHRAIGRWNVYDKDGIAPTILANHGYPALVMDKMTEDTDRLIQVGQIYNQRMNPTAGRVYHPKGISPTLTTPTGGNSMPLIIDDTNISESEMNSKLKEMLEVAKSPTGMAFGLTHSTKASTQK